MSTTEKILEIMNSRQCGELITVGTKKCLGPCPTLVNACLTQCLKCESGSSRFQPGPGEGPSRGLLSDCTTSPINRFYTALVVTRLHHRMKQCRHTVPSSGGGRGWSPLSAADDICSSVHCCGLEVTSYHKLRELAATRPAVAETWIRMVSTIYYLLSTQGVRPPLRVSTSKCWGNLPTTITVCCSKSPDDTELRDIIRGYSALSAHLNDCQKKQAYF